MESVGAFPEVIESWESLGKMFSAEEDLEFSPHFQDYSNINLESIMNPNYNIINNINSQAQESLFHSLESLTSDHLQFLSQESSYSTSANSGSHLDTYCFSDSYSQLLDNNSLYLIDQCQNIPPLANDPSVNIGDSYNNVKEDFGHDDFNHLKRDADESRVEDKFSNPMKKPRVQKSKRSAKKSATNSGRNGKLEEEISNNNTSSYSSEDENESQEKASKVVNLNGKARASRGSATDPQSLYARKRRERINERLRILQNLVPNGTKVDISTMLEEAVQYVKFLQLQIKLLSSDDMWMYAPIAYNGMDIGLNHKLSQLV